MPISFSPPHFLRGGREEQSGGHSFSRAGGRREELVTISPERAGDEKFRSLFLQSGREERSFGPYFSRAGRRSKVLVTICRKRAGGAGVRAYTRSGAEEFNPLNADLTPNEKNSRNDPRMRLKFSFSPTIRKNTTQPPSPSPAKCKATQSPRPDSFHLSEPSVYATHTPTAPSYANEERKESPAL